MYTPSRDFVSFGYDVTVRCNNYRHMMLQLRSRSAATVTAAGSAERSTLCRVYTRTNVAGYKLYPLVSTCCRQHVSCVGDKMSPVCHPSVTGYKEIQVDRDINSNYVVECQFSTNNLLYLRTLTETHGVTVWPNVSLTQDELKFKVKSGLDEALQVVVE